MKRIKDPVYGYIELDDLFVKVIDSPNFQRLRDIIQTSYSALYPSSLHNRFSHSLGVFYLGKLAFESLCKNSSLNLQEKDINVIKEKFLLACLCHDIGHSPFSHTGEQFYDNKNNSKNLDKEISNLSYSNDLSAKGGIVGKEHEVMSAFIGVKLFKDVIEQKYLDFFARCIIGLKYTQKTFDEKTILKNSCIDLLNGSVVDVDKLDYILRDSYMAGYENSLIDYKRLLGGVMINRSSDEVSSLCYKKSSLTVLESVMNAHDLEKRWIQSHPSIVYDSYLLESIIQDVYDAFSDSKNVLFNFDALTEKGVKIKKELVVKYLSDSDIKFLSKQILKDSKPTLEYFNREMRRRPIWKSEAEFNGFIKQIFTDNCYKLIKRLINLQVAPSYSINDSTIKSLKSEIRMLEKDKNNDISSTSQKISLEKNVVSLLKMLKDLFDKYNVPFDIVILDQQSFQRNISKDSFKNIKIYFEKYKSYKNMSELVSTEPSTSASKIFYIYYKDTKGKIDCSEFCSELRSVLTKFEK